MAGCPQDDIGLKALQVAVESGRAEVVACCVIVDDLDDRDGYGPAFDVPNVADRVVAGAYERGKFR